MKLFKKILIGICIFAFSALAISYFYLRHITDRAIPDYNRGVSLQNMKEAVTIYRDVYAVPHIYAKNEEDLYRAVGYMMAQDRLWQMDLLRRVTTGRLAEIFGAEFVETDLLMRALRISEKSKAILAGSNPKIINTLEAFTDGINQFIEKNKNILPPEFSLLGYKPEKWEITHSLNVVGYMAWDLTMPWPFELTLYKVAQKIGPGSERFKDLIPNINFQEPPVFPGFSLIPDTPQLELKTTLLSGNLKLETLGLGVFHGSNNWAISGKKSATGKPVLANDMHLSLFAPGIWYPMHQVVDGMLNVTGVAVPGQPFIVAGHNEKIAWGMTNLMVDDMDFYRETINPDNPNQYRFNHEWKNMEIKVEKIRIKGGNSVERKLRFTHRGPIISEFKGIQNEAISMRWTGNESSDEMRSVYLLNRAANWEDFRDAVKTFIAVSQNIAYADVNGNIGLQTCAGIPIRQGYDQFVVPGETDAYDWIGLVPFEKLPFVFNPECGYVSSANNKATANDYPYYISYWYETPCRICRIREMLTAKDKLSIDDMKQVQTNVKSSLVERLMGDIILTLKQAKDLNEPETRALALLSEWDGTLTKQSAAAAIFENLYIVMVKNLIKDEMGEELCREYIGNKILLENLVDNTWRNKNSEWCDDITTAYRETFNDWLLGSFKETIRQMQAGFGDDPNLWQWGKMHKLVINHPMGGKVKILDTLFQLNRGPFDVGGSFHTICPYSYSFRKPFTANFGASLRHIYSTADWDESQTVIPTGISGIPASSHYCDQTKLYIENKYHDDLMNKEPVIKNARYKMVITGK